MLTTTVQIERPKEGARSRSDRCNAASEERARKGTGKREADLHSQQGHCVATGINTSESPASFSTHTPSRFTRDGSVVLEMARIHSTRQDALAMSVDEGALNVMTSSFRKIIVQPRIFLLVGFLDLLRRFGCSLQSHVGIPRSKAAALFTYAV